MNKTLISIEELKQLTRDARTYPPSVFIPSQMRWPKETWSVQVVGGEGVDPQATGRAAIYLQHKLRHEDNLLTG
jgi:hypothetical protein